MIELLSNLISTIHTNKFIYNSVKNSQNPAVHYYAKDKKGKYLHCNEEMAHVSGLNKSAEIVGGTDLDFVWSEDAENYKKMIKK